jgi:hypothetical protein
MHASFKYFCVLLFMLLNAGMALAQTENSSYVYTGQMFVPDNNVYAPGEPVSWSNNTNLNLGSGWHDVEGRFDSGGTVQPNDTGTMNLFRPLDPAATTSSDSRSVPEPASLLCLALPIFLRRRHVRAQIS